MPVYEIDYTPSFYIIENTPQNIEIIDTELTAVDYLRISVSCLISIDDLDYQNSINSYPVPVLNHVSSKILIITNIPVINFNNISLLYGDLTRFPYKDWAILNPSFLGGN